MQTLSPHRLTSKCAQTGRTKMIRPREVSVKSNHQSRADPVRHVPLPNGMWLMSFLEDQFYNIRGTNYIIRRSESESSESAVSRKQMRRIVPAQRGKSASEGLVHKVVWHQPWPVFLLEGPTVDVSDVSSPLCQKEEDGEDDWWNGEKNYTFDTPYDTTTSMDVTCTGMVPVSSTDSDQEKDADEEQQELYITDSTSPRRTKMVGFTCDLCGARNHNAINPKSYLEGTLVAQCGKCERWHKISDHFNLFHNLKGPLFHGGGGGGGGGATRLTMDDVPPALRNLDPMFWKEDKN